MFHNAYESTSLKSERDKLEMILFGVRDLVLLSLNRKQEG